MPTPLIAEAEARRRFALVREALAEGYPPPGQAVNARKGQRNALRVAMDRAGVSPGSAHHWLVAAERVLGPFPWPQQTGWASDGKAVEVEAPPCDEPSYEQIKSELIANFEKRRAHYDTVKLVPVRVRIGGPFGILVMGDPHLDDAGTDWPTIDADIALVKRTRGLFAANVGDLTNNWVGRLGRLYSEQNVSRRRALILVEGFLRELAGHWLWIDGGNHDVWSGQDDPVRWFARQAAAHYRWNGNRLHIIPPRGEGVIVNSRHDHPGWSLWNPAHGPLKAAQMDALHDDIYTCGHLHTGAYQLFPHPNIDRVSHLFRASGYKRFDMYAELRGHQARHIPRGLFIVRPEAPRRERVSFFFDVEFGADVLKHLRRDEDKEPAVPVGAKLKRAKRGGDDEKAKVLSRD